MKKKEFKPKSEDARLPSTRKQLLLDIVKDDFVLIADSGLLSALFSLPLIVLWAVAYLVLINSGNTDGGFVTSMFFYNGLISLPLFAVRYLARGGVFELFKKRAFNEGYFISDSFFQAIKQNFARYLVIGAIVGLCFWLCGYGGLVIIGSPISGVVKGMGIGGCVLVATIVYCSADVCLAQNAIYKLELFDILRNGFSLAIMRFLSAIVYFTATVLLPLAICMLSPIAATIVLFVYVTFIDGFGGATATLYCHSLFDRYINAENYPTLVRRGLFKNEE